MMFEPFTIRNVMFKNRLLRSSIGGRTSYYDGMVSPAYASFEKRFAATGVAGLISATISVDERVWSPEYPKLSEDRFIKPLARAVQAVQQLGARYIIQLGSGGSHNQLGLFSEPADARSSSANFDLLYGYRNLAIPMTVEQIQKLVEDFAQAARRARDTGCDGIEITISKGYLLHQFLNPGINRRTDAYGGSAEKRFRLVREVLTAIRRAIGDDFLLGVRLSAVDYNYLPANIRLPVVFPLRHYLVGNGLEEMLSYARQLEALGVDYLHVTSGYGFINPRENPGGFALPEGRMFYNAIRHLSLKARLRAAMVNLVPDVLLRLFWGWGWRATPAINAEHARRFKEAVRIPVICNGGFQRRDLVEAALTGGQCDMVSMARPLLANPDLLRVFEAGRNEPEKPCTFCNRCAVRTVVWPLGCYEPLRFSSTAEMEAQILAWSAVDEE